MGKGKGDPNKQQDESRSKRDQRRAARRQAARAAADQRQRTTSSERWSRRLIVGGVAAVVLVAVGFIIFGWYQTEIKPLSKTVLRVQDTKYSLAHLERRMKLELNSGFSRSNILSLPEIVLAQLEGEASLLAGIDDLDLEVTDEDVAAEIRRRGGLADDVEPRVFADEVHNQLDQSGLKQNEYELMIRAFLAEQKARDYFLFLGPQEETQVRGRLLVVEEEDTATTALERIKAGEDFLVVADDTPRFSGDVELDWFPRGGAPTVFGEIEDFYFTAEPGELSDVLSIGSAFYILELLDREDARTLDDDQRVSVANRELSAWISDLRTSLDIEKNLSQDDAIRAVEDII